MLLPQPQIFLDEHRRDGRAYLLRRARIAHRHVDIEARQLAARVSAIGRIGVTSIAFCKRANQILHRNPVDIARNTIQIERMIGSSRDRLSICCCMLESRWLMIRRVQRFDDFRRHRRLFHENECLRLIAVGQKSRNSICQAGRPPRPGQRSTPICGAASPCNQQLLVLVQSFDPLSVQFEIPSRRTLKTGLAVCASQARM